MPKDRLSSARNRDSDSDGRQVEGTCTPPRTLARQSLRAAQRQLLNAREDLKAARRRVVELERVVDQWHDLALTLDRMERPAANGNTHDKQPQTNRC
jgi:hypothetical protein